MPANKFLKWVPVLLLLVSTRARAEEKPLLITAEDTGSNAAPRLSVAVRREGGPGQISADRAYIIAGTNRLAFLVPEGFRVDGRDSTRVVISDDRIGFISVKLVGPVPRGGSDLDAADYRRDILSGFFGGQIIEEFLASAGGGRGPGFNIISRSGKSRVMYIPSHAGVLEFRLDASPDKFDSALPPLNYLMQTFRASDAEGKLEATPLSDRS